MNPGFSITEARLRSSRFVRTRQNCHVILQRGPCIPAPVLQRRFRPSPLAPRAGPCTAVPSITFGSIVGNAEHLAVLGRTFAALAPCGNVVGVHFLELISFALVRAVPNRAERTVGLALAIGCLRLLAAA